MYKRCVIGDVSLNLLEDIHTADIGYPVGRGIMGWGNAYLSGVLLKRSNTWFFRNLAYKQMDDSHRFPKSGIIISFGGIGRSYSVYW